MGGEGEEGGRVAEKGYRVGEEGAADSGPKCGKE